jgi:hypothetical protein
VPAICREVATVASIYRPIRFSLTTCRRRRPHRRTIDADVVVSHQFFWINDQAQPESRNREHDSDADPASAFRLQFGHSYFTLRRARLNQTGQNGPNMLHLIVVDGVTHARIDAFGQVAAQAAKDSRRFLDTRQRNVGIHIATTNEHRRV